MREEGSTIRDKVFVGIALLVGMSPLLVVIALGLWIVDRRRLPENKPETRIRQLAPQLRDIAAGSMSAKSLIDWLEHPARSDYLLIKDRQSGKTYVVDWDGTPYFYRAAGRSGRALKDRSGIRIEGILSLKAIEQLPYAGRRAGTPAAEVTLISFGPDLIANSPDDVKLTLSVAQ